MIARRNFLKALVAIPFAPAILRGMDWVTPTAAEAAASGAGGYSATVPAGSILPYVGEKAPAGFLMCDGRSIPQFMFPQLFEAIGGAYGQTDWRTFRVPDMRARVRRPDGPKVRDGGADFHEAMRNPAMYGERPLDPMPQLRYVIKT